MTARQLIDSGKLKLIPFLCWCHDHQHEVQNILDRETGITNATIELHSEEWTLDEALDAEIHPK